MALIIATTLGLCGALLGAYWTGRWPEPAVDGLASLTQAVPDLLWGLRFILVLGVILPLLPISGRLDPRQSLELTTGFLLLESLARTRLGEAVDLAGTLCSRRRRWPCCSQR